ncbi:TraM recognition domain-containing protein [Microvirga sp. STR05]|uniref:TraM recognition domain-containing protein n=1 Tax=Hymenobacter duratus TaxID=2771356 RepID=A0ABR8JK62_9BACT|nr:type IV secretory system conjugative DNA transfer family protein [Hymenobacter duratus]MBD2717262.1 TraM recognition domain-containing protein [Hymenobacter duratus]MBR7952182.1 TraM recognition domain-containing protein [Microvirga sp. STR05]
MMSAPRQPSSHRLTGLYIALGFLLALLAGGEYYLLSHPSFLAGAVTPAAPNAGLGASVTTRLLLGTATFYQRFGLLIRAGILVAGGLLAVLLKAPPARPGQRRWQPTQLQLRRVQLGAAGVGLLTGALLLAMATFSAGMVAWLYPTAALLALGAGLAAGIARALHKTERFGLRTERRQQLTEYGFSLATTDGGWINIPNPFRGTLVLGGAGAGKSYSIGEPLIEQFTEKGFAGLIYDFKFPVLAEAAQKAFVLADAKARAAGEEPAHVQLHIINFKDLERSERVNPLRADKMPVVAYANEYARAIMANLNPESIKKMDFFDTSANAFLTAIIWFYKKNFPTFCTLPHVVNTALHPDFTHVLSMLDTDPECGDMVRSITTAVKQRAEKQVAGVIASLQIVLTRINSPEIAWVLTPDEARGEGFSLDLNDKQAPKVLVVGNDPTLKETFSPVISCIVAVALKLMNQQHKHPSYVFLDEAATIYVPNLEVIPATARSNKVAMIYMTQDLSQMIDAYGREKMQVMVSNLNNQFFGKVNSLETAKFVSELVGKEDREMVSASLGRSQSGGSRGAGSSINQSVSWQERNLVRLQDTITLETGEFIGQTVETEQPFFQGKVERQAAPGTYPLHPLATFEGGPAPVLAEAPAGEGQDPDWLSQRRAARQAGSQSPAEPVSALQAVIQANFELIREDVANIVGQYANTLKPGQMPDNEPML